MREEATDRVLVVGAGPVGLVLALVLARSRVRSLVVEARQAPTPAEESRAITGCRAGWSCSAGWACMTSSPGAACPGAPHQFRARGRCLLATPFDPIHPVTAGPAAARPWQVPGARQAAAALVRPDQEVAGVFQLAARPARSRS